ncbi:uncharacterized protein LOC128271241 [Anopheles cruzii]|uniref:uncharacterized protein LOC128271241 n=1 Tax=Anopheles cruzii TaxID=68878 RepID=UPI0022EC62E1|nr:uncharacterized protein LOC128271241 [Anopheles cruzii]
MPMEVGGQLWYPRTHTHDGGQVQVWYPYPRTAVTAQLNNSLSGSEVEKNGTASNSSIGSGVSSSTGGMIASMVASGGYSTLPGAGSATAGGTAGGSVEAVQLLKEVLAHKSHDQDSAISAHPRPVIDEREHSEEEHMEEKLKNLEARLLILEQQQRLQSSPAISLHSPSSPAIPSPAPANLQLQLPANTPELIDLLEAAAADPGIGPIHRVHRGIGPHRV